LGRRGSEVRILSPRPLLKTSFFARSRRGLPVGGDSRHRCTKSSRPDHRSKLRFSLGRGAVFPLAATLVAAAPNPLEPTQKIRVRLATTDSPQSIVGTT